MRYLNQINLKDIIYYTRTWRIIEKDKNMLEFHLERVVYCILSLVIIYSGNTSRVDVQDLQEDNFVSTPDLIVEAGYTAETHRVPTADGYILEMHRIPYGRHGKRDGAVRPPVLLQHGILCSSADWVISNSNDSLGFILADAGYDVWLGNFRGNTYSRRHIILSPEDHNFWKFSWDHMGSYDLPAMFDHILKTTKQESLFYVGHSLGTTAFWVAMNDHPEYNEKIRAMIALAPVAKEDNLRSPIRFFAPYISTFQWIQEMIGGDEFIPNTELVEWLASSFCKPEDMTLPICENVVFVISGYDKKDLGPEMLGKILAHTPAGTSSRTVVQFAQAINTHKFCKYDYGAAGNLEQYGQEDPPLYHVDKVTPPVALIWCQNDWLSDPADVVEILALLPNVISSIRVEEEDWNHLDFLWGINAKTIIYDHVLEILENY